MAGMSASEKCRRDRHRALVGRWKRIKGCARCGVKPPHYFQLDLDHIVLGTKNNYKGTHRAFEAHWSIEKIKGELSKCQVLCKNCHALKTYMERKNESV